MTGVRSSQRKHAPDTVGLDERMQTSLRRIADKAKANRKHRFQNLYGLLNEEGLKEAFRSLNKNAASGVDRVSAREYGRNLDGNLRGLVERLKGKRYRAKLVRRRHIPKDKIKTRPLGIPVTEDKLLQTAVSKILMAIFEQDFLPSSFGYRPRVGARDAVRKLTAKLQYGKFGYVVEADIKAYFNNIDHDWLIRMVRERVDDEAFLRLIRKWLKAGVLEEDGKVVNPEAGTPQGGSVSPVLANIYLHYAFDLWFQKVVYKYCTGKVFFARYADDFVCLFQYKKDAERFYRALPRRLAKFGLEVAPEKTRIVEFSRFRKNENNRFEFLGFEFMWGTNRAGRDQLYTRTSPERLQRSLREFTQWCKQVRHQGTREIFEMLNVKLLGHYNYFGVRGNFARLQRFFYRAMGILRKWLNRRSQRRSCSWMKFFRWLEIFKVERPRIRDKPPTQAQLLLPC